MASLPQRLVMMVPAYRGPIFQYFLPSPSFPAPLSASASLPVALHRGLFSSIVRAFFSYRFCSPIRRASTQNQSPSGPLVRYQPFCYIAVLQSCSRIVLPPPHPRRPFTSAGFDDEALSTLAE